MSKFDLIRTDSFLADLKKLRKSHDLLKQLDKKLEVLKEQADSIGKHLHGSLKGRKSIRIMKRFRLIFRVQATSVFLLAIDHRGKVYE